MKRLRKVANIDSIKEHIDECLKTRDIDNYKKLGKELLFNKDEFNPTVQNLINEYDKICNRQLSNILDDSTKYENVNQLDDCIDALNEILLSI